MWKQEIMDAKENFADAFMLPKDLIMNATLLHMVVAAISIWKISGGYYLIHVMKSLSKGMIVS